MNIIDFYEFIFNRQLIWHKKEILKLPFPWSDNEVLNKYKFACVYRENDRCTKYLIYNVINNKMLTTEEKIFNIILFRRFNVNGFFGNLMPPQINVQGFKMKNWEQEFDECKQAGFNIFNDAYTICQIPHTPSYRPRDKHIQILMSMEEIGKHIKGITKKLEQAQSLKECHQWLMDIKLIGPFLAYQILQDIQYIPGFLKHDINSFVHVGPGSLPTMKLLFPKLKPEIACAILFQSQQEQFNNLKIKAGKDWDQIYFPQAFYKNKYISMGNIQSCGCEWRKYLNLSKGIGRKRYYAKERL